MYKFENSHLTTIPRFISLDYSISKGGTSPNFNYIINININSKYKISSGLIINFNIPGLTFIANLLTVTNTNSSDTADIPNINLIEQKCTITFGRDINPYTAKNFISSPTSGMSFTDTTATILYNKIQIEF